MQFKSSSSIQISIIFIKKPQFEKNCNYFIRQVRLVTYIYIYIYICRTVVPTTHSQPGTTRRWLVSTRSRPLFRWEKHGTSCTVAFGPRNKPGQHGKSRLDLDSVPGTSSPLPVAWRYVVGLKNFR